MLLIRVHSVGVVLSIRLVARTPTRKAVSAINDFLERSKQRVDRFSILAFAGLDSVCLNFLIVIKDSYSSFISFIVNIFTCTGLLYIPDLFYYVSSSDLPVTFKQRQRS